MVRRQDLSGRQLDAALQLLDRQIVDSDGRMVAKVDDIELSERDGELEVTALLIGPGALGSRLRGELGRLVTSVWRRLRTDARPMPGRIEMSEVVRIDSAIHVAPSISELESVPGVNGYEQWVRQHIIERLPGASDE
ncbi:MAG TPA: hypothetical protein VFX15_00610 [Actinomycetes bacterium]|nr:hypothetical protein [Actinomycetes bacterium]